MHIHTHSCKHTSNTHLPHTYHTLHTSTTHSTHLPHTHHTLHTSTTHPPHTPHIYHTPHIMHTCYTHTHTHTQPLDSSACKRGCRLAQIESLIAWPFSPQKETCTNSKFHFQVQVYLMPRNACKMMCRITKLSV